MDDGNNCMIGEH